MPDKSDLQLLTDAIGGHGLFFKKALAAHLSTVPGVRVIGEEYPVRYMEGTSLDLLIECKTPTVPFVIPIECKRALATRKSWVFFRDTEASVKMVYCFNGAKLNVSQSTSIAPGAQICIEGIEVDSAKLRGSSKSPYAAASADSIWDAAFQICKGGLGFLQDELKARSTHASSAAPADFASFLVVVTTASLQIANLPPGSVDLLTGNHQGELQLQAVPWLILHFPFVPPSTVGTRYLAVDMNSYHDPMQRGLRSKEGIAIVQAAHAGTFFSSLVRGG